MKKVGLKADFKAGSNFDTEDICNYCQEKGHWKVDCPVLRAKNKGMRSNVKPAAFAAPVKHNCVSDMPTSHSCDLDVLAAYALFIRDGFVSLVGSVVKVPIKILMDTGTYDSYIVDSVLSLSELPLSLSRSEVVQEQHSDSSLKETFERVLPISEICNTANGYFLHNDLLVRKWVPIDEDCVKSDVFQMVVPVKFHPLVLKVAHDEGGHFGVWKTYLNVFKHFFWSRLKRDVSAYIKTCHVYQLTGKPNQGVKPAPLQPIPVVSEPFTHLIVDCVDLLPGSKSGCKYLLTVMCQSTRYPAIYPLRSITTKSVVKALSQFISIFGIPKVVQSDQGSNFSSHMLGQVLKLLLNKQNQSSAYHAQSQGALERFHQTIKSLLCAYCTELDRDWEEGLPWPQGRLYRKVQALAQMNWSLDITFVVPWQF